MLKAAFIGFGRMGITHFSILNTHPDVQVVGISDPSSIMRGMLKQFVPVNLYADHKDMLAQEKPDFVVISTPPDSHAAIIRDVIDHNCHFFVEKPLTLSTQESRSMAELCEQAGLLNQVGYVNRFCETFAKVEQLLQQSIIGEVKSFSSEMYSATMTKESSGGWRSQSKAGGGCLYEMASHAIDLATYYFGAPAAVKGSVLQSIYSAETEDQVLTTLVYGNGMMGKISVNWSDVSYRKPGNTITIIGKKGKIIVTKYSIRCFLTQNCESAKMFKGWNTIYLAQLAESVPFYLRGNEFTLQLYDFVKCVANKTPTRASCRDAAITDSIIEAILRDAERNSSEPLDSTLGLALPAVRKKRSFLKSLFPFG